MVLSSLNKKFPFTESAAVRQSRSTPAGKKTRYLLVMVLPLARRYASSSWRCQPECRTQPEPASEASIPTGSLD
eukprot:1774615-Rhodomonas_salina.1